jgi:bifunctional UDP-N-acetylglucosamine pyrophosphorylase/glucosamine-1-phosphate N-acetyltransferase
LPNSRSAGRFCFRNTAMKLSAAIVLAAGKGTRMKSDTPKVLHKVCGKEMLRHVVEIAKGAGLDPVVTIVPEDSSLIRSALGSAVTYATQRDQLGSGHAVMQARDALDHTANVVVLSGDVPLLRQDTVCALVQRHKATGAAATILTSRLTDPEGLGRILRDSSGRITAIVEQADADETTKAIREINGGAYCFRAPWLWDNISSLSPSPNGEFYLTDLIALAVQQGERVESVESVDRWESLGVNNRVQLAEAEAAMQQRIRERLMLSGVTMTDPSTVYIDAACEIGRDTVIRPNTHVQGNTSIGQHCEIGPNTVVVDSQIADNCRIFTSVIEGSRIDAHVEIGPYSHLRPGTHLHEGVHIGNFAEVKNSVIGAATRSGHFSYIGDAVLGSNVNVGAGTVTCNYDGAHKHVTEIGDNVFLGSHTLLIAPVKVENDASTGAGSIVNRPLPEDTLWVGERSAARLVKHRKKRKG